MKIEKSGVIYRIYNKVNGKSYVGQTVEFDNRIKNHFSGYTNSRALWSAICKYGEDAFVVEMLEHNVSEILLDKFEVLHIRFWQSFGSRGYNLTDGGEGLRGFVHTDETKKKMSESQMGKKNHRFGKIHSVETKRKMSDAHKGEKHHYYGKRFSDEHRRKLSESHRGAFTIKRRGKDKNKFSSPLQLKLFDD